jgi:hypothetical protein
VGAPVDVLPVADEGENEQHYRDEKQACGFGGVDVALGRAGLLLLVRGGHADIVALSALIAGNSILAAGHLLSGC